MMTKIQAYAKINLTLDIAGRREDGYHTMRMVMQSISLSDTLSLADLPAGQVLCDGGEVPCGPENTVCKASDAFFSSCRKVPEARASFRIRKSIPQQAGLGGGSADAAAALALLNERYGAGLSMEKLCRLGLAVGADVPFCLYGGTALAEGVGEKLSRLPPLPPCRIVICKPRVGISTKEAFAAFDASGTAGTRHTDAMLRALEIGSLPEIATCLGNAFETVCTPKEIREIESSMLTQGALGACMTGSGSAVFGIFPEEDGGAAALCRDRLLVSYPETFLCRPVGPNPYGLPERT